MISYYDPKKDIYTLLRTVSSSVTVYQSRPEVIKDLPSFTFEVSRNAPRFTLNKTLGPQDIEITIDIWAETSKESGTLLKALVDTMLQANYMLSFNSDVPDPSPEKISHVTTQFIYIN